MEDLSPAEREARRRQAFGVGQGDRWRAGKAIDDGQPSSVEDQTRVARRKRRTVYAFDPLGQIVAVSDFSAADRPKSTLLGDRSFPKVYQS